MKKGSALRTLRFMLTTVVLFVLSFSAVVVTVLNVYVPQYITKINGEEVAYFSSPAEFDEVYEKLVEEKKADGLEVEVYLSGTPTYELTYVTESVIEEQNQYTNLRAFVETEYIVYNVAVKGNKEMTFATKKEADDYAKKLKDAIKSSVKVEVVEEKQNELVALTSAEKAKSTYSTLVSRYKPVVRTYSYSYSGMTYQGTKATGELYTLLSGGVYPTSRSKTVLTQGFGNTVYSSSHRGLDIASYGSANVDIYSYKAGTVSQVQKSPYASTFGCYVKVYHGTTSDGVAVYSLYAHLQNNSISVNVGDAVSAGTVIGRMLSLGFDSQDEAVLSNMSLELVRSSEIEGKELNFEEVRSSIARRLGIDTSGLIPVSRYIDGVVEMQLDATQNYDKKLSHDRLFGWHNVLFPTGMSGLYRIEVGKYRSGEMQVVSGAMGKERVHYQAPSANRVYEEMERFIDWINNYNNIDAVLKAAIAHLWFVSIHPFDDGNGRITRALTDMLLARSENSSKRFYSVSTEIKVLQKEYYEVLERTQCGNGDITEWLLWFLHCFEQALDSTEKTLSSAMRKAEFWERNRDVSFNERQRKLLNMQFDGFFGKLTSSKWAKIAKCSHDTALNDINDLIAKGILKKTNEGGRSTNYILVD